jgi:hypothetical protein
MPKQKQRAAPAEALPASSRLDGFTVTDDELSQLTSIEKHGQARPAPGFSGQLVPKRRKPNKVA